MYRCQKVKHTQSHLPTKYARGTGNSKKFSTPVVGSVPSSWPTHFTQFGVYATLLPTGIVKIGKGSKSRASAAQTYFVEPVEVFAFWIFGRPQIAQAREKQAHATLRKFHCSTSYAKELFKISKEECLALLTPVMLSPLPAKQVAPKTPPCVDERRGYTPPSRKPKEAFLLSDRHFVQEQLDSWKKDLTV